MALLKNHINSVSFSDDHMEDMEISAVHRKLQSKNEALKIMRNELERFRTERDQFKLMAETIQMRYSAMKNSLESCGNANNTFEGSSTTLGYLLGQSREKNIELQTEVENLRQKLNELQGDIKVLRMKKFESTKITKLNSPVHNVELHEAKKAWNDEKSRLIDQLEGLKKKNAQLQFDFRSLLDEKEEVVGERDAFKCKAHRLNHELTVALKGDESVDVDTLILENKFLNDRMFNLQKELEIQKKEGEKLQQLLKPKRVKGAVKFGTGKETILSHKQVTKILNDPNNAEIKSASTADLKALCLALLDNLNDKSLALTHQKQTNRLIATKVASLEQKLSVLTGESVNLSASQVLLKNYSSSKVDDEDNKIMKIKSSDAPSDVKSYLSSEYETQSSDISSELRRLDYIKIINDEDDEEDLETIIAPEDQPNDEIEELQALPPDIHKLVDDAMKSDQND